MAKYGFVEDMFQAVQFDGTNEVEVAEFLGDKCEGTGPEFIEMCDPGTSCMTEYEIGTWFLKFDDGDVLALPKYVFDMICYPEDGEE